MSAGACGLVAVQCGHPKDPQRDVPGLLERAGRAVSKGGIAVLPEYFYRRPDGPPDHEALAGLEWVADEVRAASSQTAGALVATVPEREGEALFNTAVVAEGGEIVHRQRKLRPTLPEREAGIQPTDALDTVKVQGIELGVLVCADVLALDVLARMRSHEPDVVAVPVLSRYREHDPTQAARTSVFVARSWDLGAYVVKAGGHAAPDIVGRSLITAPWGVLASARGPFEDALLQAPFDGDALAEARRPFDPMR